MNKYTILGTLVVLIVLMGSAAAIAPATTTWISETRGTEAAAGSDITEGGNITVLNLSVSEITDRWAGYLGNLSGNITLRNAAGTAMYLWTWDATQGGEVCSGTAASYTWSALAVTTAAEIDNAWSFGGASDNATNTFTDGGCTGNITIAGIGPMATTMADTGGAGGFETCAVEDAGAPAMDDLLFCSKVNGAGDTAYDGTTVQWELMVPVTYGSSDTYYFYAELN